MESLHKDIQLMLELMIEMIARDRTCFIFVFIQIKFELWLLIKLLLCLTFTQPESTQVGDHFDIYC